MLKTPTKRLFNTLPVQYTPKRPRPTLPPNARSTHPNPLVDAQAYPPYVPPVGWVSGERNEPRNPTCLCRKHSPGAYLKYPNAWWMRLGLSTLRNLPLVTSC